MSSAQCLKNEILLDYCDITHLRTEKRNRPRYLHGSHQILSNLINTVGLLTRWANVHAAPVIKERSNN